MTVLQSPLLADLGNIHHGMTTRDESLPDKGNVSLVHADPSSALHNRKIFAAEIGVSSSDLTFSFQEHGTTIRKVVSADRGAGALMAEDSLPAADGLITTEPNLPLAIMVADCACLLVSDREGQAVGAFHAGWRGTLENMPGKLVSSFQQDFNVAAHDLVVWITPLICRDCFEVGEEVWELFRERWGTRFVRTQPLRIDLPGLLFHQTIDAGVSRDRVEMAGLCTLEETSLFSHRRGETPNGRMMGVIAKKK